MIDKRGFLPTFSLVNVRNFFRWARIAFMAADGGSFPVPSSSPQHTHTDPSWQSTKTGYYRTHTPSRPGMLPAVSIDRAATENITDLGRNVGHQFGLPELMLCLAPAPSSIRPSRVDAMPRPDGRLVRRLSSLQRPSRVDAMLCFGGSTPSSVRRPSSWLVFPS